MESRSAQGFAHGTLVAAPQPLQSMLGFARTARIHAAALSPCPASEMRRLRSDYYRYVVPAPSLPTIVVTQYLDERRSTGSVWGEVNSAVHEGLGVASVLSDGLVRDVGDLSPTFPLLMGRIGPSHAFVHVVDIGGPAEVFGLSIVNGDLVNADQHGAVLIAPEYLPRCRPASTSFSAKRCRCSRSRAISLSTSPRSNVRCKLTKTFT